MPVRTATRLALLAALLMSACSGQGSDASESSAPEDQVSVEADIYSGQPNPAWTTSTAGLPALSVCLADLEAVSLRVPTASASTDLGFRGFRLTSPGQQSSFAGSGFNEVVVTSDAVHARDDNGYARLPCPSLYDQLRTEAASKMTASQMAAIPSRTQG
ncbi:hypothetical protein ACMYYO_03580 [Dermacoccaceae bacterium W4C1]